MKVLKDPYMNFFRGLKFFLMCNRFHLTISSFDYIADLLCKFTNTDLGLRGTLIWVLMTHKLL